jgi:hypothetical protein
MGMVASSFETREDALLRMREAAVAYQAVIASQRVGAKRRPMPGSATQSMVPLGKHGLLGRFAPRNDDRASYLIGGAYWMPPLLQSELRPRGIFRFEPSPTLRS